MDNLIELKHIKKCYVGDIPAVCDINLKVKWGEFVTLLGPSGCGKSTIIRMIAGFEQPTSGQILLEGKDISTMPPNERKINTVFQKYALFPHLNIYDNIAFGLREKKMDKALIDKEVKHVLEVVDLEGFEKRKVQSLSGGQQQRIAIARAIVNKPDILLLDEPLGALDYKMRVEMQLELKRMHKELGITFIFVTHNQEEALTMSDKIVVMSKGMKQQEGTPEEIYSRPVNAFVADFIGESNIFNGRKTREDTVRFMGQEFICNDNFPTDTEVDAMIRPELVELCDPEKGQLTGEVISSIFKGKRYEITLQCGKNEIVAESKEGKEIGEKLGICFPPSSIHNMLSDGMVNHLEGILDEEGRLRMIDGSFKVDITEIFPEYTCKDGKIYDSNHNQVLVEGTKVEMYFAPEDAALSDNPEEGHFLGHITSIIYKGDHYNYRIMSKNKVEYSVDDEYLWNVGDYVSIVVPRKIRHYNVYK